MNKQVASIIIREPYICFEGEIPVKILLQIITTLLPDRDWSTYIFKQNLKLNKNLLGQYIKLSTYHILKIGFNDNGEWLEIGEEKKLDQMSWYKGWMTKYIWVKIYKI